MHSSHSDNRRRHPRIAVGYEVQLQPIGAPIADMAPCRHYAISRDISLSGMRVWADRHYPVSSQLLLTFACEELGWSRSTSRVGSVVWVDVLPSKDRCQLGIQFGDAEDPSSRLLQ